MWLIALFGCDADWGPQASDGATVECAEECAGEATAVPWVGAAEVDVDSLTLTEGVQIVTLSNGGSEDLSVTIQLLGGEPTMLSVAGDCAEIGATDAVSAELALPGECAVELQLLTESPAEEGALSIRTTGERYEQHLAVKLEGEVDFCPECPPTWTVFDVAPDIAAPGRSRLRLLGDFPQGSGFEWGAEGWVWDGDDFETFMQVDEREQACGADPLDAEVYAVVTDQDGNQFWYFARVSLWGGTYADAGELVDHWVCE